MNLQNDKLNLETEIENKLEDLSIAKDEINKQKINISDIEQHNSSLLVNINELDNEINSHKSTIKKLEEFESM